MPYYPPASSGGLPAGGSVGDLLTNTAPGAGAWNGQYPTTLGKVALTGHSSRPTLFDPASTVFTDGPWHMVDWSSSTSYNESYGLGTFDNNWYSLAMVDQGASRFLTYTLDARSTDTTKFADTFNTVFINKDGTSRFSQVGVDSDQGATAYFEIDDDQVQVFAKAAPAQTGVLFDLQTSASASIVSVTPTKIAMFGGTGSGQFAPIADASVLLTSVVTQFNTLLADLRLRGDLAT